jgi:outer membrane protein assembly factor BamB
MISRRAFLSFAAVAPGARVNIARDAAAADLPSLSTIPVRKAGKVEIAFKSPGPQPNGLQATKEGLWIIDQSAGSRAYLVDYADGKVLRSFDTDTVRPSGITFDGEALWIGSTFSYENVRCNAMTGAVIERRPTPGSIMYTMAGDPPQRRSPLAGSSLAQTRPVLADDAAGQAPLARLIQPPSNRLQGAHGQEWRDGKLWTTSTSARTIYCIDAKTWTVEKRLPVPGNRPHGLAWDGRYLWHGDANLAAFFKYDTDSGAIVEKIQLGEGDPVAHGLTIWNGTLWYCDDVGVVCRLRM